MRKDLVVVGGENDGEGYGDWRRLVEMALIRDQ